MADEHTHLIFVQLGYETKTLIIVIAMHVLVHVAHWLHNYAGGKQDEAEGELCCLCFR